MSFAHHSRAPFGRTLCLALGLSLVAATLPLHAAATEPEELLNLCRVDSLPQDIRNSLSRYFGEWKVQEPNDLGVRARTRWGEERPLTCPGIAVGHFQSPKAASYALLLVPTSHASNGYKLVIYTQQSSGQYYGFKAVVQEETGGSEVFLSGVPAGRFFDVTSKWVSRSHVSDAVMLIDSAAAQSYLYVWSDVGYERADITYQQALSTNSPGGGTAASAQ